MPTISIYVHSYVVQITTVELDSQSTRASRSKAKSAKLNMANSILVHINYITDKLRVYDDYATISVVM